MDVNEEIQSNKRNAIAVAVCQLPVLVYYIAFLIFNEIQHGSGDYSYMREFGCAVLIATAFINFWFLRKGIALPGFSWKFVAFSLGDIALLFLVCHFLLHPTFTDNFVATNLSLGCSAIYFSSLIALSPAAWARKRNSQRG